MVNSDTQFFPHGCSVFIQFNMDQIALQKIATSMSIGDFRSVNRNRLAVEVSTLEPVLGDNVELLIEIMDELQIRTDVGHDSGETEDVYSSIEEFVEIASSFDFQVNTTELVVNYLELFMIGYSSMILDSGPYRSA